MFVESLNDIGYGIIELHRGAIKPTDSLDLREVKSWVHNYRAFLLHQKFMRPLTMIDQAYKQDLGAVALEVVDSSILNIPADTYLVRTTVDIPNLIEDNRKLPAITRLSSPDMLRRNFNFVSYERALVSGNGRFNSDDVFAFMFDNRLYLISKENLYYKGMTHIHVEGVFEDVTSAYRFKHPDYDDDMPYPITKALVAEIESMIVKEKLNLVRAPLKDVISDDADNLVNLPG
jgi:hypothetical protein